MLMREREDLRVKVILEKGKETIIGENQREGRKEEREKGERWVKDKGREKREEEK